MPRSNLAWILGIAGVVLVGYTVSYTAPTRERDRDYELVRLVIDVMSEVDHKYVRPLDADAKRKLIEDMINGGLARLDPHSTFINKREYKRFSQTSKGKFGGVGIQLGTDSEVTGRLMVVSPLVDTPAYDAGILAGDLIMKIDGKSTENLTSADAVDLIQGEPGSKITLTVLHEGSEDAVDVEMARAEIEIQSVLGDRRRADNPREWEYVIDPENKIACVRLIAFSENTAAELRTVMEKLQKQGIRGLVLDLRTNPGGLLRSAVDICRMFISEGVIVSTRGRNQEEQVYEAKGDSTMFEPAKNYPMVVLINRLSASASEIVAAALQDHKRAVIIGERSYGKGSVQNVIDMEGHTSALKLTTASYWRPSGKNIHRFPDSKETDEWGVKPDTGFEVAMKDKEEKESLRYLYWRRDRDVVPGKGKPLTGKARTAKGKEKDKEEDKTPFVDRTMEKALKYLRDEVKKVGAAQAREVHDG